MATYNGHKNWSHWNVSLWINNDHGLYQLARGCVRGARNRQQAAEDMLTALHADGITKTPDGARYSVTTIRAAMVGM